MEKKFKHGDVWDDHERLLVIIFPWEHHESLARFLSRTEAAVRMKKDSLMYIYAETEGIGVAGLDAHSEGDEEFMNRWRELACDQFKVAALRRAFKNLKKGVS